MNRRSAISMGLLLAGSAVLAAVPTRTGPAVDHPDRPGGIGQPALIDVRRESARAGPLALGRGIGAGHVADRHGDVGDRLVTRVAHRDPQVGVLRQGLARREGCRADRDRERPAGLGGVLTGAATAGGDRENGSDPDGDSDAAHSPGPQSVRNIPREVGPGLRFAGDRRLPVGLSPCGRVVLPAGALARRGATIVEEETS